MEVKLTAVSLFSFVSLFLSFSLSLCFLLTFKSKGTIQAGMSKSKSLKAKAGANQTLLYQI